MDMRFLREVKLPMSCKIYLHLKFLPNFLVKDHEGWHDGLKLYDF